MGFDLGAYAVSYEDPLRIRFHVEAAGRGYSHTRTGSWPAAPGQTATDLDGTLVASEVHAGSSEVILEVDGALAAVVVADGAVRVTGAALSPVAAAECVEYVRGLLPPYEGENADVVPVTFWSASTHGGHSMRREVDASSWEDVASNYPRADGLAELMSPEFRPGVGGQLLLWHGDAGTGKTTALRALAREWRDWCGLHYIVDPEAFFGHRADYMMQVMMGEEVDVAPEEDASTSRARWRLLVLEDCGEMLQPDAKQEVGQALSRLLNACDGLIGRGLRVLVLITTNEPVERLHKAVDRPGRCAARVEFAPFSEDEAHAWLVEHDADPDAAIGSETLADLYGLVEHFRTRRRERPVGFDVR